MQQSRPRMRVGDASGTVSEQDHHDGRRHGEAGPGREAAAQPAAHQPDAEARLAGCRSWQKLRQCDEIDKGALGKPAPPLDEFRAKIAEMGDRTAKAGAAEPQEDQQDLERRTAGTFPAGRAGGLRRAGPIRRRHRHAGMILSDPDNDNR